MSVKVPLSGSSDNKEHRKGVYGDGVDWSSIPSGNRFNPYDFITQDDYRNTQRGHAAYTEDLSRLQYLADLAQQDWQNAYNEARVADERAYQEKITADNRAYNERMIAEDREYNSYANQVALMRQAGLNPDLLGVSPGNSQTPIASGQSVGSNSSASGSDVKTNPISGIMTNGQLAGNVVSIIGSIASTAMSIASGPASIAGLGLSNLSSAVSSISNLMNLGETLGGAELSTLFETLPFSAGLKRKLKRFYDSQSSSPRFNNGNLKFEREYLHTKNDFHKDYINPLINPLDYDEDGKQTTKDWQYVWQPLFEAEYSLMQSTINRDINKTDYENNQYKFLNDNIDVQKTLFKAVKQVGQRMNQKYQETNSMFWGASMALLYNSLYGNGQLAGSVIDGVGSIASGVGSAFGSFGKKLLKFK